MQIVSASCNHARGIIGEGTQEGGRKRRRKGGEKEMHLPERYIGTSNKQ
jgi:hypothetical protein